MSSTSAPTAAPIPMMAAMGTLLSDVFSPSHAARESHVVRGAPQTESSAPPQQAAAAAHTNTLTVKLSEMKSETASHAAASASLAADLRCAAQKVFIGVHEVARDVKDEPPMVAVAVLLKVAGLAHTCCGRGGCGACGRQLGAGVR